MNTGCFVCEDDATQKKHGLCCDLVHQLHLRFCNILSLYSKRYDTRDQKKLQDIVIKNVVEMLNYKTQSESNVDDTTQSNPISRYKFCQLDNLNLIPRLPCLHLDVDLQFGRGVFIMYFYYLRAYFLMVRRMSKQMDQYFRDFGILDNVTQRLIE